jgi:hypothetical protein
MDDFHNTILVAQKNQMIKATQMGEITSRMHTIIMTRIEASPPTNFPNKSKIVTKLIFVDSSGSERNRKSGLEVLVCFIIWGMLIFV